MSVNAPKKTATKTKIIRVSDDTAVKIDEMGNGIYASRGDFVLNAIREFSSDSIRMFWNVTSDRKKKRGAVEKQLAEVEVGISRIVNRLVVGMPDVPPGSENTTQIMVYIPRGLEEQMEFVLSHLPFIKNKTVYIRVAIEYKFSKIEKEMYAVREFIRFISQKDTADESVYLASVGKNCDRMFREGEMFVYNDVPEDLGETEMDDEQGTDRS